MTPQDKLGQKQEVSIDEWDDMVRERYKIPRNLWKAMSTQESGGDWDATSPTGVKGKYQVTEATAKQYGLDRNDPFQQTVAAARYLRDQYDALKDLPEDESRWLGAVGRYYGGPGAVDNSGGISTKSPDGVSTPDKHIERVAKLWGQFERSMQESGQATGPATIDETGRPLKFQSVNQPPAAAPAPPPAPKIQSRGPVRKPAPLPTFGGDPTQQMLQDVAARPVTKQKPGKVLPTKPNRFQQRSTLGQIGETVTTGVLQGADWLQRKASYLNPLVPLAMKDKSMLSPEAEAALAQQSAEQDEASSLASVGRGTVAGALQAPAYLATGMMGPIAGAAGAMAVTATDQDWRNNPKEAAIRTGLAALPIAGSRLANAALKPVTAPGVAATEALAGGLTGAGASVAEDVAMGRSPNLSLAAQQGVTGAVSPLNLIGMKQQAEHNQQARLAKVQKATGSPVTAEAAPAQTPDQVFGPDDFEPPSRPTSLRTPTEAPPPVNPEKPIQSRMRQVETQGEPGSGRYTPTPEVEQGVTVADRARTRVEAARDSGDVQGELAALEGERQAVKAAMASVGRKDAIGRRALGERIASIDQEISQAKAKARGRTPQQPQTPPETPSAEQQQIPRTPDEQARANEPTAPLTEDLVPTERELDVPDTGTMQPPPDVPVTEDLTPPETPRTPAVRPQYGRRTDGPIPRESQRTGPREGRKVKLVVEGREQEATLTPEQAKAWDDAERDYQEVRKNTEDNTAIAPSDKAKNLKALGMKHAARKREIAGVLTGKEQEAATKREASNYKGKRVSVDGREGEVVGNAFGKVKVRFDDGSTSNVTPDVIQTAPKPKAPPLPSRWAARENVQPGRGQRAGGRIPGQEAVETPVEPPAQEQPQRGVNTIFGRRSGTPIPGRQGSRTQAQEAIRTAIEDAKARRKPPAPPKLAGVRPQVLGENQLQMPIEAGSRTGQGQTLMYGARPHHQKRLNERGREVIAEQRATVEATATEADPRRQLAPGDYRGNRYVKLGSDDAGKLASYLFESNTPESIAGESTKGREAFLHDPDVKGALGLSREATENQIKEALNRELAGIMNIRDKAGRTPEGGITLRSVPVDVWKMWARRKSLPASAMAKFNRALRRLENPDATPPPAPPDTPQSQRSEAPVRRTPASDTGRQGDAAAAETPVAPRAAEPRPAAEPAEQPARAADDRPVTYYRGDEARYTGKTIEQHGGTFYEIEVVEGRLAGQKFHTPRRPDGFNPAVERVKQERQAEQEEWKRLRETEQRQKQAAPPTTESSSEKPAQVQKPKSRAKSDLRQPEWMGKRLMTPEDQAAIEAERQSLRDVINDKVVFDTPAEKADAIMKGRERIQEMEAEAHAREAARRRAAEQPVEPVTPEAPASKPKYEQSGKDMGELYHGSKERITSINPDRLQYRDAGFYGKGFYITKARHYAKTYGPVMNRLTLTDDARVLRSDLTPEKADPDLVRNVKQTLYDEGIAKARERGKESAFLDEINGITDSPINWKNAVDRFADIKGYDVVAHGDGEIVVKNPSVVNLQPDKSSAPKPRRAAKPVAQKPAAPKVNEKTLTDAGWQKKSPAEFTHPDGREIYRNEKGTWVVARDGETLSSHESLREAIVNVAGENSPPRGENVPTNPADAPLVKPQPPMPEDALPLPPMKKPLDMPLPEPELPSRAKQAEPQQKEPWQRTREEYFNDAEQIRRDVGETGEGYRVRYKYTDPGGAGPFEGSMLSPRKLKAGEEVQAPFGRATVTSSSPSKTKPRSSGEYYDEAKAFHRRTIENALAEGKPVPPEVLADYPDLAPKAAPEPPAAKPKAQRKPKAAKPETQAEAPDYSSVNDYVLAKHPDSYQATKYLSPEAQYQAHLAIWRQDGSPRINTGELTNLLTGEKPSAAPQPEAATSDLRAKAQDLKQRSPFKKQPKFVEEAEARLKDASSGKLAGSGGQQPVRFDPSTGKHDGVKLTRGDEFVDADGNRYMLDRDQGFILSLDQVNEKGQFIGKSRSISVDPTDKGRFLDVFRTGKNLYDDAGATTSTEPATPKAWEMSAAKWIGEGSTRAERQRALDTWKADIYEALKQGEKVPDDIVKEYAGLSKTKIPASRFDDYAHLFPDVVANAQKRINSRKAKKPNPEAGQGAMFDDMADQAIVSGYKLYKAGMQFKDWTRQMLREFGSKVRPHLRDTWQKLTAAAKEFYRDEEGSVPASPGPPRRNRVTEAVRQNAARQAAPKTPNYGNIRAEDLRAGASAKPPKTAAQEQKAARRVAQKEAAAGNRDKDMSVGKMFRSPLSNLNYTGTYERLAGETGKEISEAIRNYQVLGKDKQRSVSDLRRELQPKIEEVRDKGLSLLADQMEAHVDSLQEPAGVWKQAANKLKGFQYNAKLRLNPRSTIINLAQPMQTLWPHLSFGDMTSIYREALTGGGWKRVHDLALSESGGKVEGIDTSVKQGGFADKYLNWFGKSSDLNRVVGHLAGERIADRLGLTGDAKKRMAADWAKKVEFDNSKYDVPPAFRGDAASVLMQFKPFMVKNLERIASDWNKGIEGVSDGNLARRSKMVIGQIALGGMKSVIPGVAHLKAIGGVFVLGTLAKQLGKHMDQDYADKVAETLFFGLPGLLGQDWSGSVGIIDEPFGTTTWEKIGSFLLGPTVSTAVKLIDGVAGVVGAEDDAKRGAALTRTVKGITPFGKSAEAVASAVKNQGKPSIKTGKTETPMTIREAIGTGITLGTGTPIRQSNYYDQQDIDKDLPKSEKAVQSILSAQYPGLRNLIGEQPVTDYAQSHKLSGEVAKQATTSTSGTRRTATRRAASRGSSRRRAIGQ